MRKLLPRFRLRASDFLGRQKVTKDRLKDPWSLRIPFASKPGACLPSDPALCEPTRFSPACCRPWVGEGPSAPDDKAPCVGGHWDGETVAERFRFLRKDGYHPPTGPARAPAPTS